MSNLRFKRFGWLLITGVAALWIGSVFLRYYHQSIESTDDLVSVDGYFITGTCEVFRGVSSRGMNGALLARSKIQYSYKFQGHEYHGDRYARSKKFYFDSEAECEQVIEKFRKLPRLNIWIDTKNPSFSVIENKLNPPWFEYIFIAVGSVLFLAGCYLTLLGSLLGSGLNTVRLKKYSYKSTTYENFRAVKTT